MSARRQATAYGHPLDARAHATALLTGPAFVLALLLLVANDWLLKPAFGNWLTGKLSDVAGLFAWAIFWSALAPSRRAAVWCLTTVAWLLWKSPLTDAPIAAWNALGAWPLGRVVDCTDWLALAALVPAWHVVARAHGAARRAPVRGAAGAWRRVAALGSLAFAIVAFSATTLPRQAVLYPDPPAWVVAASRDVVRDGMKDLGFTVTATHDRIGERVDSTRTTIPATFRIGRTVRGEPVFVELELVRVAMDTTRVVLRDAYSHGARPQAAAVRQLLVETIIAPLRMRFGPAGPVEP